MTLTGCASPKAASPTPDPAALRVLASATRYFSSLQEQGKAPGLSTAWRGKLDVLLTQSGKISYPATVIIRAKDPKNFICSYKAVQDTVHAPWRLVAATRSDKDGHVVEDLLSK